MTLFFTGIPLVLFDDCIQFTFDLMQKSADMHQNDNSVIIYIYCTMMLHIQHPASNIHHTNVSVTQFNSRWYLCAALHPICQKFPHCCLWNNSNVRLIDDGPRHPFKEDHLGLPHSTPLTDSVYVWSGWFRRVNRNSTVTYFVTITCAGYFSDQIGWWIVIAVTIKMMTITKCVTDYCMAFAYTVTGSSVLNDLTHCPNSCLPSSGMTGRVLLR